MIVTEYAIEREAEREVLHVFCHPEHGFALCPRFGQKSGQVHDEGERCIRHLEIWGKTTYVHFPSRRFECK
jgi:transposase